MIRFIYEAVHSKKNIFFSSKSYKFEFYIKNEGL